MPSQCSWVSSATPGPVKNAFLYDCRILAAARAVALIVRPVTSVVSVEISCREHVGGWFG